MMPVTTGTQGSGPGKKKTEGRGSAKSIWSQALHEVPKPSQVWMKCTAELTQKMAEVVLGITLIWKG